jgi:hypothetical protein
MLCARLEASNEMVHSLVACPSVHRTLRNWNRTRNLPHITMPRPIPLHPPCPSLTPSSKVVSSKVLRGQVLVVRVKIIYHLTY